MVDAHLGYKHSQETREKISEIVKGENNGFSKLNESEVLEIKTLLSNGVYHKTIAPMFGVSLSTINKISRLARWAHVQLSEVI